MVRTGAPDEISDRLSEATALLDGEGEIQTVIDGPGERDLQGDLDEERGGMNRQRSSIELSQDAGPFFAGRLAPTRPLPDDLREIGQQ